MESSSSIQMDVAYRSTVASRCRSISLRQTLCLWAIPAKSPVHNRRVYPAISLNSTLPARCTRMSQQCGSPNGTHRKLARARARTSAVVEADV